MVVSPSAAVLLAAASLLLCSSASPIGPSTDIRTRSEVSSRLVSPTRGSLAGADALEQLGRRQWFNPYQGTPVKGFDSHIFTHPNGKRYIIWSDHATLVMAEMLTSTTVGKPSAVVSMMGDAKTKLNFSNTEAPTTVIAPNVNGSSTINLVFSTGDFRTPDYTTRVLTIDSSSDPMVARSWTLQRTPVLQTDAGRQVYGPGSVSFFDCEAGRKCIAYGAWAQANTVDEGGKRRSIRIQHVDFDASGKLQPMTPIIPTSFAE